MLRNRFGECGPLLDLRAHFADDAAQRRLFFRIGLFVESGERSDQRQTGIHHGGELAGEKDEISLGHLADATQCLPASLLLE